MAGIADVLQSGSLAYTNPSPASVAARRAIAQQLLESTQIKNAGPLGALANALGGFGSGYMTSAAAKDEATGQEGARKALLDALQNPNASTADYANIMTDPWQSSGGASLASTLLGRQMAAPPGPIKVSAGESLVDPGTFQTIYSAPAEAPKPTGSIQEYNLAVSQGYQGSFADYEKEMRKAGATSIDFNANQGTAAAFADRMATADTILNDPNMVNAMTDVTESVKGGIPVVGNFLTSAQKQQADQAQRDFINAILRRESGAVISPSEFENARQQYFPQPGDTPEVIAQKAQNRRTAIEGVQRAAGPNYQPPSLNPGGGGVVDWTTYFGGQ